MDGFKNIYPQSPSTKHSEIPKLSSPDLQSRTFCSKDLGKVNENDKNAHQMGSKMPSRKSFMSPTVSTASRAASARKVLGERNEQSAAVISASHDHKSDASNPRDGIKSFPCCNCHFCMGYADVGFECLNRSSSRIPYMSSKVSELDQEENTDPSSEPYDPLTNYLSPRPKFLRYKPNRRLEFLLRRETERTKEEDPQESIEEEESSQSGGADGSSFSSSEESSPEQEDSSSLGSDSKRSRPSSNEERNPRNDDEDMEEFEVDERHWHFNKVFKTLLLLGILILSTMYISSMHHPTAPPSLLRFTMANTAPASYFLDKKRENCPGIINGNETVTAEGIQGEEMVFGTGMQETGEAIDITLEVLDLQNRENMEASDNQMGKAGKNFYQVAENLELEQLENEAHSMPDSQIQSLSHSVYNQSAEIKINLSKEGAELVEAEQEKDEDVTEASGGGTNEVNFEHEFDLWKESVASGGGTSKVNFEHEFDLWKESVRKWMEKVDKITGGTTQKFELLDRENNENSHVSQTQLILDAKATKDTASDIHSTNGTNVDLEEEDQIKFMKSQFIAEAAVGVSVIAVAMVFGLLRLRNRRTIKVSQLRVQSSSESVAVDTRSSELPPSESVAVEAKGNSHVYRSPSVHSSDKAFKELHQSGVPKVELLGEFTVGEISSSIKSCGLKSKKVAGEESTFSVSQDKRPRRKPSSSVNDVHLCPSESSAAEFPSYGSFTAQASMVKKEDGNDGEEVKTMATPVRRSNRIRNRAVTSP